MKKNQCSSGNYPSTFLSHLFWELGRQTLTVFFFLLGQKVMDKRDHSGDYSDGCTQRGRPARKQRELCRSALFESWCAASLTFSPHFFLPAPFFFLLLISPNEEFRLSLFSQYTSSCCHRFSL